MESCIDKVLSGFYYYDGVLGRKVLYIMPFIWKPYGPNYPAKKVAGCLHSTEYGRESDRSFRDVKLLLSCNMLLFLPFGRDCLGNFCRVVVSYANSLVINLPQLSRNLPEQYHSQYFSSIKSYLSIFSFITSD